MYLKVYLKIIKEKSIISVNLLFEKKVKRHYIWRRLFKARKHKALGFYLGLVGLAPGFTCPNLGLDFNDLRLSCDLQHNGIFPPLPYLKLISL